MVIISTSATEVSIQAVSPELGVHFSVLPFSGLDRRRTPAAALPGRGGAAAGAAAGACA